MTIDREGAQDASEILASVESMTMDRTTSKMWVLTTNGKAVWRPFDTSFFPASSVIVRTRYVPSTSMLFMETNRGDTIETELPTYQNPVPIDGRPVVYLDQRDWSFLAKVLFEPECVQSDKALDAATQLIALARDRRILLPMSFGHLGETSWRGDTERRYHLALTLTQLSRGWQMRYPIDVWQDELNQAFSARFQQVVLSPLDVFTLDACAVEPSASRHELGISSVEFPKGLEYVYRAMLCMMSYIDTSLSSEASSRTPIPGWVDTFQSITDGLAGITALSAKRDVLRALLLKELKLETVATLAIKYGVTAPELEQWVDSQFEIDIRAMKCFGLWSEVYRVKHLDSTTKWSKNDLVDLLFLTCAAGYADYVLGERSATSHLNQAARRLGRSIQVYSKLEDLLVALQDDLR